MDNYPDDIGNYECSGCGNLSVNCTCQESAEDYKTQRYYEVLHSDDEDVYFNIFDSQDSDEVAKLLRDLHRNVSLDNAKLVVAQLDKMLTSYIENEN